MLYNISNHPCADWDTAQMTAALELAGEIIDVEFPSVSPCAASIEIKELAQSYASKLAVDMVPGVDVAHVMGEMTFCYALVRALQQLGVRCFASTTTRQVSYNALGQKVSQFHFVMFREYPVD